MFRKYILITLLYIQANGEDTDFILPRLKLNTAVTLMYWKKYIQ